MKDIFDIKWSLYWSPFGKDFFLYFIGFLILFLTVFIISYYIDKLVKFIKKLNAKRLEKMLFKKKYIDIISNLWDENFFGELSFYVRDYFEKSWIIDKSTKKTATELKTWKHKALDDFFIRCRDMEFSKEKNNIKIKEEMQDKAIKIIQNNIF